MQSSENLLPLSVIKKIELNPKLDRAEFYTQADGTVIIYLLNDQQRILIARRQGDVTRKWRSVDTAIELLKTNFNINVIKIYLDKVMYVE